MSHAKITEQLLKVSDSPLIRDYAQNAQSPESFCVAAQYLLDHSCVSDKNLGIVCHAAERGLQTAQMLVLLETLGMQRQKDQLRAQREYDRLMLFKPILKKLKEKDTLNHEHAQILISYARYSSDQEYLKKEFSQAAFKEPLVFEKTQKDAPKNQAQKKSR